MASPLGGARASVGQINIGCSLCGTAPMQVVQWAQTYASAYMACELECYSCGNRELQNVAMQLLQQGGIWTPSEPEPATEPVEPPPVIQGSVIGYRAWRIMNWQLYGTGVNRVWVPGVNEATCNAGEDSLVFHFPGDLMSKRHAAPAEGCDCGITALARFTEDDAHWRNADVFGAIEAWSDEGVDTVGPGDVAQAAGVELKGQSAPEPHGRFILHRNGFRAQFGKIVLLAVDDAYPRAKNAAIRALASEHGADVCKRSHLEDAAKEHGQLVPEDMLTWAGASDPPEQEDSGWVSASITINLPTITTSNSGFYFVPPAYAVPYVPSQRKPRPTRPAGIKMTIGYPGPPADPTQKARQGDRVRDSRGDIWRCAKGGKPGTWEREE